MSGNVLQDQKASEHNRVKCVKCGAREATKEDHMCDNCRFIVTIDGILESRKTKS
jgi:NMD protein affecting ribosome stability and mRNA decay